MPFSLYLPASRSSPEIYPPVRDPVYLMPPGLPMANTCWPMTSLSESPNSAGLRPLASVFSTARSVVLSTPTTTAACSSPSEVMMFTRVLLELSTTWALVMI